MSEAEIFYCAKHPETETTLRCSKCGIPICPRCMVQTPVGARCRTCARIKKTPTYDMTPVYYLRAVGAGIGGGLLIGLIWGLISLALPTYLFALLLAAGAGFVIGEIINRAVNRKRGTLLAIIGGLCVILAYGVAYAMELNRFGYVDFNMVRIGYTFLSAGVGIFIAVNRLR